MIRRARARAPARPCTRGIAPLLALASAALAGCADAARGPGCVLPEDCGSGSVCLAGTCVPRAPARRYWVELQPRAGSGLARTELGPLVLAPGITLALTGTLRARVTLAALDPAWTAQGHSEQGTRVTLFGTTGIPAQPPPAWGGVAHSEIAGQPAGLTLELPAALSGRAVELLLQPTGSLERALPPWRERAVVAPAMTVALPGNAAVTSIEGSVRTALDGPALGYVARARRQDRAEVSGVGRVSNLAPTDADGRFRLVVPRALAADPEARIEITVAHPSDRAAAQLGLDAPAATASALPSLRLPAHPAPEPFRIPVVGVAPDGARTPVSGALVRLETELSRSGAQRAWHRVEGETDAAGLLQVSLLAGELGNPRRYAVAIAPPPESRFAGRCIAEYTVVSRGSTSVPVTTAELPLSPRTRLAGQVLEPDNRPARAVAVRAEQVGPPADPACPLRPAPAVTTTDAQGRFELWLEPGVSRLTYQPPAGTALPAWQEELLVSRDVTILRRAPAGVLIEGTVRDPQGRPGAGCEVRLYLAEGSAAGTLAGRAISDATGAFRIVVPR